MGREISEQKVWQILTIVQLADWVHKLPNGLNTLLGEQGNMLSAGQKQLLALARALVQTPKILILDEATANVDSGTERAIQAALQLIRRQTTLIVIAHRLSTVIDADKILSYIVVKSLSKANIMNCCDIQGFMLRCTNCNR